MSSDTYTTDTVGDVGPPLLLPALWTAKWSIGLTMLIAALLGFGLSSLQSETYEAQARLLLTDPRNAGVFEDTGVNFLDPSRYIRNQAELAGSVSVMNEASALTGGRLTPAELTERVVVRASVDLDLLTIIAHDMTGPGAAELADAVAQGYQAVVSRQVEERASRSMAELSEQRVQLEEAISAAEQQIAAGEEASGTAARDGALQQLVSISNRIDQIAVDASLFGAGVDLFEPAEVPTAPSSPKPLRNAFLIGVLGTLSAVAWAWWRSEETAQADERNDPAKVLRAPLLGTVPAFAEASVLTSLPTITSPTSPVSESYQFLVNSIEHALPEEDSRAFIITSAGPTDGKTLTAANLGIAAAQDGREVLLVDADTRVRGLTRLFDVESEYSFADLAGGIPLADVVTVLETGGHHAALLPAVPLGVDTAAFFRTPGFQKVARTLATTADFIIYDTPPLLLASDTSSIAANVSGIVLVVARGTSLKLLRQLRERLDRIATPVIGYVFTKDRVSSGYYYGKYGYADEGYGSVETASPTVSSAS